MKFLFTNTIGISLILLFWSLNFFWRYDFINDQGSAFYATLLWFTSIVTWSIYAFMHRSLNSKPNERERLSQREKIILLSLLTFAFIIRFYKIDHYAAFLDDWYWLDQVRGILQGFVTTPFGFIGDQPSNLPAFIVLPIYIFTGKSYLAVRITGILLSLGNIVIMFYLARLFFNKSVALFTVFFVATSIWDIHVSKIPWINTTINPVLLAGTLYYVYKSVTQYSLRNAMLAGLFIGVSINLLYLAAINAIALLVYVIIRLFFQKHKIQTLKAIATVAFTGFLVSSPTIVKILKYPQQSIGRHESFIGKNVLLSSTHGYFMYYFDQFQSAVSRFFTHYASYNGHVYPYWGITIEPIIQFLMIIGFVYTILRWKDTKYQILLISFVAMFIPVVLLERGISEWREYGFFNHIYLFAGVGGWFVFSQIQRILKIFLTASVRIFTISILILLLLFVYNFTLYYTNYISKNLYPYENQCREIAEFIIKNADSKSTIYLPSEMCTQLIAARIWDKYTYINYINQRDLQFRLTQNNKDSVVVKLGKPFYPESNVLGDFDVTTYLSSHYDQYILPESHSVILIKSQP